MQTRTVGKLIAGLVGVVMIVATVQSPDAEAKAELFLNWIFPKSGQLQYGQNTSVAPPAMGGAPVQQQKIVPAVPAVLSSYDCAADTPMLQYFRRFTLPEQFDAMAAAVVDGNVSAHPALKGASQSELLQALRCADPRSCESGPVPLCNKHGSCGPGMRCAALIESCRCVAL